MYRNYYFAAIVIVLSLCLPACKEDKKELENVYNNFRFDNTIINKLPLYDSLVAAIQQQQSILRAYSSNSGGTNGFRYMPLSTDSDVYKQLPPEVEQSIGAAYKGIGDAHIAGFDLFPDSSIRIYIRRTKIKDKSINIDENLSFLPGIKKMRERTYPEKDTSINNRWQYWARVNDEGIF